MEININQLKSYCLDLLMADSSIKEKEDCEKYANKILSEWSLEDLKSYAVCESLDTLEYQTLIESDVMPLVEKFDLNEELQEEIFISEGIGKTILGIFLFGAIPWAIWRVIKHDHDKNTQQCKTFGLGKSYDKCMLNAKIKYLEGQIKVIEKNMSSPDCNESCISKSHSAITKLKVQIQKLKMKLSKLSY